MEINEKISYCFIEFCYSKATKNMKCYNARHTHACVRVWIEVGQNNGNYGIAIKLSKRPNH